MSGFLGLTKHAQLKEIQPALLAESAPLPCTTACFFSFSGPCAPDMLSVTIILTFLVVSFMIVVCVLCHMRVDLTAEVRVPFCPRMISVGPSELTVQLSVGNRLDVLDAAGKVFCGIEMERSRFVRQKNTSIASIHLYSPRGNLLGTSIARKGLSTTLIPIGQEPYGIVMEKTPAHFEVRHCSNGIVVFFDADFTKPDTEVLGYSSSKQEIFRVDINSEGFLTASISDNVDVGLVLCSVLGARMQRLLATATMAPLPPALVEAGAANFGVLFDDDDDVVASSPRISGEASGGEHRPAGAAEASGSVNAESPSPEAAEEGDENQAPAIAAPLGQI